MLVRLLKTHLAKYRWLIVAVVVLQLVQTTCTLYLPSLNAKIIDRGIATGDHGYIWRIGLIMLAITCVQVFFSIGAVYYGSRTAMGFGRDVRSGLFHKVTDYSTQEVNLFGAPSLITRITPDVQQVQLLVLLTCSLLVAAPITLIGGVIRALREDVGLSGI
ncbi:MAG: Xenobiotic-transporting ATPase, partial [Ilumatobacteraceae bacterium]|nr:Xenobiotic-transporting ATPase [Ilumatobacteraceae bacterium]